MRQHALARDGELLRAASVDPDAFSELYRRYEGLVAAYHVRQMGNSDIAADLTAETFAIALLRASRYRDTGDSAAGWLLGIAHNLQLNYWRKGRTEQRARHRLGVSLGPITDESLERVEALIDVDAAARHLRRAFARLPDAQREAITARVLDEQSYSAVAERVGVSEATVRQRVSRGLTSMRTALKGQTR